MKDTPLHACITCGTTADIEPYFYEFTYSPMWVFLFVFLCGPLPTLLLYRMMRQQHVLEAYFCNRCWSRSRTAGYLWPGLVVLTVLFIIVGLYVSAVYKTDDPITYLMIASVVLAIPAFVIRRLLLPKVVVSNEDQVRVHVPHFGVVTLYDSTQGKQAGLGLR